MLSTFTVYSINLVIVVVIFVAASTALVVVFYRRLRRTEQAWQEAEDRARNHIPLHTIQSVRTTVPSISSQDSFPERVHLAPIRPQESIPRQPTRSIDSRPEFFTAYPSRAHTRTPSSLPPLIPIPIASTPTTLPNSTDSSLINQRTQTHPRINRTRSPVPPSIRR